MSFSDSGTFMLAACLLGHQRLEILEYDTRDSQGPLLSWLSPNKSVNRNLLGEAGAVALVGSLETVPCLSYLG